MHTFNIQLNIRFMQYTYKIFTFYLHFIYSVFTSYLHYMYIIDRYIIPTHSKDDIHTLYIH
jgi:hypothetical protein